MRQLGAQQRWRVVLDEDLGLEVEAGREAERFVRRTRETIAAAVLASAIRVDAELEADVRTVVSRDDRPRVVAQQLGLGRGSSASITSGSST